MLYGINVKIVVASCGCEFSSAWFDVLSTFNAIMLMSLCRISNCNIIVCECFSCACVVLCLRAINGLCGLGKCWEQVTVL